MSPLARGVLFLAAGILWVLITLGVGLGGSIEVAVGVVLAVYGLWQLLVGVGRLRRS